MLGFYSLARPMRARVQFMLRALDTWSSSGARRMPTLTLHTDPMRDDRQRQPHMPPAPRPPIPPCRPLPMPPAPTTRSDQHALVPSAPNTRHVPIALHTPPVPPVPLLLRVLSEGSSESYQTKGMRH